MRCTSKVHRVQTQGSSPSDARWIVIHQYRLLRLAANLLEKIVENSGVGLEQADFL